MTKNQKSNEPQTPQDPPLTVNGQYIKDLSFELPDALTTFGGSQEGPTIDVNVNVGLEKKDNNLHEVTLTISVEAKRGSTKMFLLELDYAGLFTIGSTVPDEAKHPILFIECPRLLFPFARSLVSTITREAGFPALNLNPIDFVDLYRQQVKAASERNNKTAKDKANN